MDIEIIGNTQTANEIIALTQKWDKAVEQHNLKSLLKGYIDNIEVFDIGSQLIGHKQVEKLWEHCFPFFGENPQVYRHKTKLYAGSDMAFMHFFSKICGDEQLDHDKSPWCRTTVCFQKTKEEWKAVHEHISMPIDFEKGIPALITEKP